MGRRTIPDLPPGWSQHQNANQRFIFTPLGHGGGYIIQSEWNGNYMTVEDGICTGIPVVGSAFPATWVLQECPQWLRGERINITGTGRCFRIRWPNSRYVVDLEGYGCDKDGTRVSSLFFQKFRGRSFRMNRSSLLMNRLPFIHAKSGGSRR